MIKVLVLEEDNLATDLLKESDFAVEKLSNPDEFLECIKKFDPQVIVTDLSLPGIDGFSIIRVLHKLFPNIKIIAFSTYAAPDKFEVFHTNALKLGAVDFIGKPYDASELTNKIRRVA